jgi:hypothetical protein
LIHIVIIVHFTRQNLPEHLLGSLYLPEEAPSKVANSMKKPIFAKGIMSNDKLVGR